MLFSRNARARDTHVEATLHLSRAAQAALVGPLVEWLARTHRPTYEGVVLGAALALTSLLQGVSHHAAFYVGMRGGWNARMGVVRRVDPFDEASEDACYAALRKARLLTAKHNPLDVLRRPVGEGGGDWSVGERQLLCLARALLLKRRIVSIDEATANVDLDTDRVIQTTLKTAFPGSTVIVVAHRLQTVQDSDVLLVHPRVPRFLSGPVSSRPRPRRSSTKDVLSRRAGPTVCGSFNNSSQSYG